MIDCDYYLYVPKWLASPERKMDKNERTIVWGLILGAVQCQYNSY